MNTAIIASSSAGLNIHSSGNAIFDIIALIFPILIIIFVVTMSVKFMFFDN